MDMRKFTEKSLTAVQGAQSLAKEYGNQEIGQLHLCTRSFQIKTG